MMCLWWGSGRQSKTFRCFHQLRADTLWGIPHLLKQPRMSKPMRTITILAVSAIALANCTSTSVTPISQNQFLLSTSAAPACGQSGATKVAAKMAAVETIRRGYGRFVILGARSDNNVSAINTAPTYSTTTGTYTGYGNTVYGNSTTTYGGGGVVIFGSNDAKLHVLMLSPKDRGYSQGVDAKRELGTDWQKLVKTGIKTCTN